MISRLGRQITLILVILGILATTSFFGWEKFVDNVEVNDIELGALVYPVIGYDQDTGDCVGGLGTAGWNERKGVTIFKHLGLTVEDYGGEYRFTVLHGTGPKQVNQITMTEWIRHVTEFMGAETLTATYEEMMSSVA